MSSGSVSLPSRAALQTLLVIVMVGVAGLVYPFGDWQAGWALTAALAVLSAWLWCDPGHRPQRIARRVGETPWAVNLMLALLSVPVFFGWVEAVGQFMTRNHLLPYRTAMQTMAPDGEDWRLAHITADELREPDPVLLWRPVPEPPYNSHRFKGPEPEVPKPDDVFRIITYGDSNTDGPDDGGWPVHLHNALAERPGQLRYEVLNAGVAGYTSYQGLRRFESDVERYEPDLILVAFGWNDASPAGGAPDRLYEPPSPLVSSLLRIAVRYRSFLAARELVARLRPAAAMESTAATTDAVSSPRVTLQDYRDNLGAFIEIGDAHDASVVLLTRPHRPPVAELEALDAWRSNVPSYNRELLALAAASDVPVVDVRAWFHERRPNAFVDESHLSPQGYAALGGLLARELRRDELLQRR